MPRPQKAPQEATSFVPSIEGFTASQRTALKRLWLAYDEILRDTKMSPYLQSLARSKVVGAIRYITYPEQPIVRPQAETISNGATKTSSALTEKWWERYGMPSPQVVKPGEPAGKPSRKVR